MNITKDSLHTITNQQIFDLFQWTLNEKKKREEELKAGAIKDIKDLLSKIEEISRQYDIQISACSFIDPSDTIDFSEDFYVDV